MFDRLKGIETNLEKLRLEAFRESLASIGRPDELLHVGDSLESDIAGANTAGVKSAWLNRNNAVNNTSYIPDFEIASLRNLLEILPLSESVA